MIRINTTSLNNKDYFCCCSLGTLMDIQPHLLTLSHVNILLLSYLAFPNSLSTHSLWPRPLTVLLLSSPDLYPFVTFKEWPPCDSSSDFPGVTRSAPPLCSHSICFMYCSNIWPVNGKFLFSTPGDSKLLNR